MSKPEHKWRELEAQVQTVSDGKESLMDYAPPGVNSKKVSHVVVDIRYG